MTANVSRETSARLEAYVSLLMKWNTRINLIGRSTVNEVWTRHIEDSQQVFFAGPATGHWADLGTGAGFPGLVVAILAREHAPDLKVTLVEADKRKAAFCRTVARELDLSASVISERIESTAPLKADIVSARALAPLDVLLGYAERHLRQGGTALFSKGAGHRKEIEDALANWRFSTEKIPSTTDQAAVILRIGDIARA